MVQTTVLKVQLSCEKCNKKILKSVSGLDGVDKIEIDAAKDTLTVTGDADPYAIILRARKAKKCVEVVTIGPEKKPVVAEKKPPDVKLVPVQNAPPCIYVPHNCPAYRQVAVIEMTQDPCTTCSIM